MLSYKIGKVISIDQIRDDVTWLKIELENGIIRKAINYNGITGPVNISDDLVVNTTATELSLGTGGQDFVILNLNNKEKSLTGPGHIMKLRYTPMQIKCNTVEEESSIYHESFKEFKSLNGHPVIIATLHSMLGPIAASLRYYNEDLVISYIMTDDAALPAGFSNTVVELKEKKILNHVITIGHAFGGDYESTNLHTGLITSEHILKSDLTIIAMGPGIVGTGTKYGFTGINQANQIDTVNNLGGYSIAVPRISFADKRTRHKGLSHHSITSLGEMTNTKTNIIFPNINDKDKNNLLKYQIKKAELENRHNIIYSDSNNIGEILSHFNLNIKTMGRSIEEDYEFFQTLGAVGNYTSNLINKECNKC